MKTLALVLSLLSLNLFAGDDPSFWRIVPGKSFGKIKSDTSEADLKKIFGKANVTSKSIDIGEGETEAGAVVYASDSKKMFEVFWIDKTARKSPSRIRIRGDSSVWKTAEGVSLGTTLKELEKLNGKPFSLSGFAWDFSGTVSSWESGKLASTFESTGRSFVRLGPDDKAMATKEYESVIGDREFSSKIPAMQKLNPRVYAIEVVL